MEKTDFVKDLRSGVQTDSLYAIRSKMGISKYRDKPGLWFTLKVGDSSGDIMLKYWGREGDHSQSVYQNLKEGDVIHIIGDIKEYQGALEIGVTEGVHELKKTEEFSAEDFVPKCPRDIEKMYSYLQTVIESVQSPDLKRLLDAFFGDESFVTGFNKATAAMRRHHNYIGGLLEHTIGTVELCEAAAKFYEKIDRDLLITGAILHDIGKMEEYAVGTSITNTDEGRLRGHLVIGDQMVKKKIEELENFPEDLALKLSHMILSHHGQLEWGSPKLPQTPEAVALHHADNMDAHVKAFLQSEPESDGDLWVYDRLLDRHIYFG